MKKSLLVALGLMSVVCLAACNKQTNVEPVDIDNDSVVEIDNNEEVVNQIANPASVYCEENGGTVELLSDENYWEYGVCHLSDGTVCEEWAYYKWECYSLEWAKTSLTLDDLNEIDQVLFPKWYSYETYGLSWEFSVLKDSGEYQYPEDLDHSLLLPIHATMASREIVDSSIEDNMIYTLTNVTLQDWTPVEILYINHPITLQYYSASVTLKNWDENSLYLFNY